jgi:hypothetical protein
MVKRVILSVGLLVFSVSFSVRSTRAQKITIPAGSVLHCRLTQTVTTQLNVQGDPFAANVSEPLMIDGHSVIPVGAKIEGRIAQVQRPGHFKGVGEMRLAAEKVVMPDGATFPISAILTAVYGAEGATVKGDEGGVHGPNARVRNIEEIGAGMGGGGLVGTLFGGLTGMVVGGAIGGAAGFVDTVRRRGPELALPVGTQLNYQLTRELEIEPQMATEKIDKIPKELEEKPNQ